MAKSKMDSKRLLFAKNPPESNSLVENQKHLNSTDFRLKEAMIKADSLIGPQLIWSFDDEPIDPNHGDVINKTNTFTNTTGGGGTSKSTTTVTDQNFHIPNHVYYSAHDWPMKGILTCGLRVVRFISLFMYGDYCATQQDRFLGTTPNWTGTGISPQIDPIKNFSINIPTDGKAWLKSNKLDIENNGDVMIAGHYGPCNWVGPETPFGGHHHFRWLRYIAPMTNNDNFLNTDVLNILILFNNAYTLSFPALNPNFVPGIGTNLPWLIGSAGPQIVDFPRYVPWAGSSLDQNGNNFGGEGLGNGTIVFGGLGLGIVYALQVCLPLTKQLFTDGPLPNPETWPGGSIFNTGPLGQYWGNGSFPTQYGTSSTMWENDIKRLTTAYPKFYRHRTLIFHSSPPPYGLVSGLDTSRTIPNYSSNCFPPKMIVTRDCVYPFDAQVKAVTATVKSLLQTQIDAAAAYGVSYGGTVNEKTTFNDFIPFIQDYLNNEL